MAHAGSRGAADPSRCWSCGGPHQPAADKRATLYRKVSGGWGVVPPVYLEAGTYQTSEVVIPFCQSCRRGTGASNVEVVRYFLMGSALFGASWAAGALVWHVTEVEESAIATAVVTFVAVAVVLRLLMRSRQRRAAAQAPSFPDVRQAIAGLVATDPLAIREYPAVKALLASGWGFSTLEADRAAVQRRRR